MSSIKVEIPKDAILNGSNYADWKMLVTSVFEQQGLEGVILEGKEDDTKLDAVKGAKTFLLFSLDKDHRSKINHCSSAREIWVTITSIYENTSKRVITTLFKKLVNFKFDSLNSINSGISEMQTIFADLKSRQFKIDDKALVGLIENALPEAFSAWQLNWSMRETEPTLNELISSINNHLETLKPTEEKALLANYDKSRAAPRQKRPTNFSGPKSCKYCKKTRTYH